MNTMSKTHGTRYAYNAGCRCNECRSANNTYMSQYRRDRSKLTPWSGRRNNLPWDPWEDAIVSNYTLSAWQIAGILERTHTAVTNRRRILIARKKQEGISQ